MKRDSGGVIHITGEGRHVSFRSDGTQEGSFHELADEFLQYKHRTGDRVIDRRGNTEPFEEYENIRFLPKGPHGAMNIEPIYPPK